MKIYGDFFIEEMKTGARRAILRAAHRLGAGPSRGFKGVSRPGVAPGLCGSPEVALLAPVFISSIKNPHKNFRPILTIFSEVTFCNKNKTKTEN